MLLSKTIDQACLEVEEEFEHEEIKKFQHDYHQRRQIEYSEWQTEVKREITRIKIKNKMLENAQIKRKQQIETMSKLQCLNIAKSFLANNFVQSMQYLAEKNHWRDTFKDQLNVNFKEWLVSSVEHNLTNKQKACVQNNQICDEELAIIGQAKEPIKRKVQFEIQKKEKFRMIESKERRIVHFLFNPGFAGKISPFARRLRRTLDGTLQTFIETEKQLFDEYIEKFKNEELEESEQNPIQFEESPYFQFQLEGIHRLCFSTADDPFYKLPVSKFYPECVVVSPQGTILATINPQNKKNEELQMRLLDDFRDSMLKINDDKKIQIGLGAFKTPGTSIFLIVREFDLTGKTFKESDFDRAWFRLSNEETNQTLDYSLISKIEKSEEYQP